MKDRIMNSININLQNEDCDIIELSFNNERLFGGFRDTTSDLRRIRPQIREVECDMVNLKATIKVNKDTWLEVVMLFNDMNTTVAKLDNMLTNALLEAIDGSNIPQDLLDSMPMELKMKIAKMKEMK